VKHNQVTIDPQNLDQSIQQLQRFYRLPPKDLDIIRRVAENYPKPIILYVDEANAATHIQSPIDDAFTFNTQTGELVLFSADTETFIDALIEMWMYTAGFETMMGDSEYWKVEFAIGAWKPVKNNIKRRLNIEIPVRLRGIVGLPPDPNDEMMEDPYPFKTLVESFNLIAFTQMARFAGRDDIRVHFPQGTDSKNKEAYYAMRRAMREVGHDLNIEDIETFNQRLHLKIQEMVDRFSPHTLPIPEEWQAMQDDKDAATGETNINDEESQGTLLLGPSKDEPSIGQLPSNTQTAQDDVDQKLANSPFADFIDTLFDD